MNLKFQEFQKLNLGVKELDEIRTKSFKQFEEQGFPTKRQEHWKQKKTHIQRPEP